MNRVRDKDVPYMTPEWKSAIRAKRKANAKYLKNKTPETWELRRKTRNEATKQRRIAIKNYWKIKADDLKSNPRDFFKTFKPFLSTKDCATSTDIQLKVEGTIVKDQRQVSEILVDYFSTIADGIGGDIAKLKSLKDFKDHPSVLRIQQQSVNWSRNLEVKPITQGQVLAALESLNTNKATGYDNIPAKVLKIAADELAKPLTTLFNSSIRNCVWPRDWKHGVWTPVYKKEQLIGAQVSTGFEDVMLCLYVC